MPAYSLRRPAELRLDVTSCRARLRIIFLRPTYVQRRKNDLKNDKSICPRMHAPNHPKDIAREKDPKAYVALYFTERSDQPRRGGGQDHRRPLNEIDVVHAVRLHPNQVRIAPPPRSPCLPSGTPEIISSKMKFIDLHQRVAISRIDNSSGHYYLFLLELGQPPAQRAFFLPTGGFVTHDGDDRVDLAIV